MSLPISTPRFALCRSRCNSGKILCNSSSISYNSNKPGFSNWRLPTVSRTATWSTGILERPLSSSTQNVLRHTLPSVRPSSLTLNFPRTTRFSIGATSTTLMVWSTNLSWSYNTTRCPSQATPGNRNSIGQQSKDIWLTRPNSTTRLNTRSSTQEKPARQLANGHSVSSTPFASPHPTTLPGSVG